jgi:hypothetical protein
VKRERMLQVALGLVGLIYVAVIYPLYTDLAHSKWLLEMKDACEPMFLSWFIALGPFLLLAARKPSLHRSLITFAACQSLAHASVMTIQTVEAWKHGVHRDFTDVVLFGEENVQWDEIPLPNCLLGRDGGFVCQRPELL